MINRSSHRFLSRASLMVAAALLGTAPSAKAATLSWDGADLVTSDAQGGTGTWDTNTTVNWWDGASNVVWPALGGLDDDAVFGGTAGNITIAAGGVTANDLTFTTTGYVLGGGVLTLNGVTPTITVGSGLSASITAKISGSSGLTKAGNGILNLSGANDFTGTTFINAGTIKAGSGTALGGLTGGTTIASGATLDIGGQNLSTEVITIAGTGVGGLGAIINTGAEQANALGRIILANHASIGGAIRWDLRNSTPTLDLGGFTLTKLGTNYLGLVAAAVGNPGNIVVNEGELSLTTGTTLAGTNANSVTVNNGGRLSMYQSSNAHLWTLNLNDGGTLRAENGTRSQNLWLGPVNAAGNVTLLTESGHHLTLLGTLSGTANITKSGAGTAIIAGNYALTGNLNISAGTLQLGTGGTGGSLSANSITLGASTNLIFNQSADRVQGTDFGAISGSGNFNQNGSGNITFGTATAQTYTGGTFVNRGTLTLDFANLVSPTNMISASSALTLGGGRLSVLGKSGVATSQTFAGATVASGASSLALNRGTGTSTTVTLGAVTRSAGGTVAFVPATAWGNPTPSTTEIVTVASISNVNGAVTMPAAGATAFAGAGFFVGSGTGTRYAVIQGAAAGPYRLMSSPTSTGFVATGGSAATLYSITANQTLTGATTNYALIGNAGSGATITTSAGNTYTANGLINIQTGAITVSGTGNLIIGAERDFVANMTSSGGLTISSVVADNAGGASNFTVSSTGAGVVTLSNAANTYTGITTINSGTLAIAADLNLGAAPGTAVANKITMNGGTLSITPAAAITIASNRGMTLGAGGGTWTNTAAQTVTYGGIITGPGALTLNVTNASGGFTFGAASTFTGGATLSGSGTVFVANSSAFGVGGTVRLNGAQMRPSTGGAATIANPVAIAANTTFPSVANEQNLTFTGPAEIVGGTRTLNVAIGSNVAARSVTFSGPITESTLGSGLTKSGAGELVLSGVAAYTGPLSVTAGRLSLARNFSLYGNNGASWTDTNIAVSSGATLALRVGGFNEFTAANVATLTALGTATGGFTNGSFIGLDTTSGNFTYANTVANTNAGANTLGVIKLGTNNLTLSAANTYTGRTAIGGGVLIAGHTSAFGPSGNTINFVTNPASGTAGGNLASGNLEFAVDSSVNAYNLEGSSNTASTLTLNRATPGAAFQHTLGNLVWGNNVFNLLKGANVTSGIPAVSFTGMSLTAGNNGAATLAPSGTNILITGPVNITANNNTKTLTLDGNTDGNLISGDISNGVTGIVALAKNNTSAWTLAGSNSYTGNTTVNAGTLTITGAHSGTGDITVAGGTLIFSGNNTGNGAVTINSGSLLLSGTSTGSGATNVVGGLLQAGADGALNPNSAVTMTDAAAATLDLNGKTGAIGSLAGGGATGGNVTLGSGTLTTGGDGRSTSYAGSISGTGNLIKTGAGVFTLASAQSYAGTTSVSNGTLLVNSTLASSGTTVASGGTLGGTGTLTNLVTINSGGNLSPATATTAGTLTIGSLTLDAGATLAFEFGGTADLVAVTTPSGLTINGGAISVFAAGGASPLTTNGTYPLFTYVTGYAGSTGNLSVFNSQAGKTYSITDTGSVLQLVIGTATTSDWSGTFGDGLWTSDGTGGNWNGAAAPNSLGAVVNFGNLATTPTTVTLNGGKTIGSIIFDNTNGFTIGTNADALTLDNGIAAAAISATTGSHSINAPIALNGPVNITPAAGASLGFGAAISGVGRLVTFSGAGSSTLSVANSYSGGTVLSAGTLNLGHDGALGSGTLTISGGTLDAVGGARSLSANNAVSISGDFAFAGTNDLNLGTGSVNTIGVRTITTTASTLSIGGIITGSGLTKAGAGTLVLSGLNTYTGPTSVNAGVLAVDILANGGVASNIGQSTGLATNLVLGGGTLRYTGATATTNRNFTLSAATNSTIEVAGNTTTLTLAGAAATTGSLIKTGAGVLTVSGASSYTGTTTVNAGRLVVQGAHASSGNTIASGAVLELNSAVTRDYPTTSFNGAGTLRKTGAGEIFWGAGTATFALASGALIDVQEGVFKGGSNANEVWTNNLADLNVATGARFDTVEANVRLNKISGAGRLLTGYSGAGYANLTIGVDNGSSTFEGTIENSSSTGNLVKAGTGTIVLTGANTYTGTTTVSAGTLTLSGNRTANSGVITIGNVAGSDATLNITAGTFAMGGNQIVLGTATAAPGVATANQSGGAVTFTSGNALLLGNATSTAWTANYNLSAGSITTNFAAESTTRGVMLGTNANSIGNFTLSDTGLLNLIGGGVRTTLQVGRHDSDADATVTRFLQTGGTATIGNLSMGGNVETGADGSATLELTGGVFSAVNFNRIAAGNRNTNQIIIGGTADVTLPAFPTVRGVSATATLTFDGGTLKPTASSAAYISGLTNAFIQDGGAKFDTNTFDITVSQNLLADPVSLGGGLTKTGNGALTLSGTNTFTGAVTITGGSLVIGSAGALNATAGSENTVSFGSSTAGTLVLGGRSITIAGLSGSATGPVVANNSATNAVLTVGNSANLAGSYAGTLQDGTGGGSLGLTKAGNGTLTLSGTNTYSGTTTISAGVLATGASNVLSPNSDFILADVTGATLSLGGFSQTLKTLTGGGASGGNVDLGNSGNITVTGSSSFGGAIVGTGTSSLTKSGNGTLTLTGASTYAGATNITAGTLVLSGTGSVSGTTSVDVNGATATLSHRGTVALARPVNLLQGSVSGTGTINALTVSDSPTNTLSPGVAGVGTLTVGSLDFLGQARVDFLSTGGIPTNFLSVGNLNLAGNVTLNVLGVPQGGWTSGTYDLLEYSSMSGLGLAGLTKGNISGESNRTTTSLKTDVVGKVSLVVSNNIVRWTGVDDGIWSGPSVGNWQLHPDGTATSYVEGEPVLFDDSANAVNGEVVVTISNGGVAPSAVTFNNSSKDYRLDGDGILDPSLQQTVGLVKNGTGKLTISATNLYSGTTLINAGNITMEGFGSLGQNAPLIMAGGQLDLGGAPQSVGALSITGAAASGATIFNGAISATAYTVGNATGDAIIDANLGGTANLTKNGAGRATLSQANGYTGTTTINAGNVTLAGAGTLGAGSSALTLAGGQLDLGTNTLSVGALGITAAATSGQTILNGGLTGTSYEASNANGDAVVSANLLANSNAVGFTKTGAGTVTLTGANTFTGTVAINGGVLSANTIADTVSSSIGLSLAADSALSFGSTGGTLRFTGTTGITKRSITFTGPATFEVASGSSLTLGTTTGPATTTDGAWAGAGSITKTGNGTLALRNNSTVTGGGRFTVDGLRGGNFSMQAGTLNITPSQYFTIGEGGSLASSFTQSGGIVNFTPTNTAAGNDVYVGNSAVSGQLIVTGGTFNVTPSTLQIRVGQATAGTLSVGGGAGVATVDSPTVALGLGNGNGVVNLFANGILVTSALRDGGGAGTSVVSFDGGTLRAKSSSTSFMPTGFTSATITANGLTVDNNGFDVTISQVVGGAGALTKSGAGVLTLSGTNTYAGGTTINVGTLALGNTTNTLANSGAVNINGGTLDLGANTDTVGLVTLNNGSITGTGALTGSAYAVKSGTVGANLAGTGIALTKDTAGTVTITAASSYTGSTMITDGTLVLSGAGAVNASSGVVINGSGAKMVQASSTAVSAPVTLTQGTLTGAGTFGIVTVGAGTGGIISNNNGMAGAALTIDSLTLAGAANISLHVGDSVQPALLLSTLTNNASANAVTLTANRSGGWTSGTTYSLISYGTLTGSAAFTTVVNDLSGRQSAQWSDDGSTIQVAITGDSPYWVGSADNKWNTSVAGNWRLLSDDSLTAFIATDEVLFDDRASAAGPVTVDIDQANVAPFATIFNSAKDYILTGAYGIATGSLTKSGTGTLTIGTANTYAGATSINAGRVILSGAGTLGSGSSLTMAGGSLDLGGNSRTVGAVSVTTAASAGDTIGNGSLTGASYAASNATGTAVISANLLASGAAGFVKTGAGAVTLSGANAFTGGFTLGGGTVNINSPDALGTGPLTFTAGTIDNTSGSPVILVNSAAQAWNTDLVFTGTNDLALGTGAVTLGGNRIVTVGGSVLNVGGAIGGGAVSLTKSGAGTLVLGGAINYSGVTNVQNGGLRLASSPLTLGTVVLGNNADNGKLILGGSSGAVNQTLTSLTTSGTGTANAVVGGASTVSILTLNTGTTAATYAGLLGGAGTNENNLSLAKTGASVLTLSGTSTYDGVTTVTAGGAIIVTADGALGSAVGNTILTGVAAGNAGLIGLSGGVNYVTAERIVAVGAGNTAALTGLAAVQRGVIQSVSGNNSFAGTIEVSATGMTRIGVQDGAQLNLTGPIVRSTGITGVTILFRAGTNDGDFITLSSNANDWDMDTQIYSSNAGTGSGVRLGISNALPTAYSVVGATSTFAGTLLDLAGFDQTLNGLTSSGNTLRIGNTSATPSTLTLNNLSDKASGAGTAIIDGAGAGKVAVVKTGTFYQALQSVNTYTGGTWIKEGDILLWSGNDRLAPTGTVTLGDVSTTGRLVIGETGTARTQTLAGLTTTGLGGNVVAGSTANSTLTLNIASGTNTFSGTLGGSTGVNDNNLNLIKAGNGTLVLSGANTYAGGTTFGTAVGNSAGVLRLASSGALGSGKLTINNGNADTGTVELIGGITITNNIDFFGRTSSGTAAIIRNVSGDNELSGVLAGSFNGGNYNFHSDAGTLTISNRITTNSANRSLNLRGNGTIHISGVIENGTGGMGVRTMDAGTYVLSGANTYTGVTTVSGGTLRVTSLAASGASSVGASDSTNAANLQLNGAVRLEYAGAGEATSRSFTVSGTGMTLASSGSGALDMTSATQVAFAADGASARELKLAGTNTGDNTYAAAAAGTPAEADVFRKITKNEVGKWVIAGSGTTFVDNVQVEVNAGLLAFGQASQLRSGAAVVNGGTLSVSSGANTNASVTVNNGGTLAGAASLGAVTVNNGGALSPGNSPGIFTSTTLSLAGGAIINWQVMDALGVAGTGYDRLVTGQLDLTGASSANKITLKISSVTALDVNGNPLNFGVPNGVGSIRTFQFGEANGILLNNGQNISDVFAFDVSDFRYSDGSLSNASLWSINWDAGTRAITLTAVPEPSTYGIGLGALALAAAALRRRRKQTPAS